VVFGIEFNELPFNRINEPSGQMIASHASGAKPRCNVSIKAKPENISKANFSFLGFCGPDGTAALRV